LAARAQTDTRLANHVEVAMRRFELTKDAVLLVIIALTGILLATGPTCGGSPKTQAKQAQAEQREYLPVLLQKALLENERENIRSLANLLSLLEALREPGAFSPFQVDQVEQELLQGRIRVLQREADYRDALDQFQLQLDVAPERLQKLEESAMLPLTRHLQRFEAIFSEHDAARARLSKSVDPEKASKLRALLRESLTSSALVQGSPFTKQFAELWGDWEKLKDLEELLRKYETERRQLRDRRVEFQIKNKPFPKADVERLEKVDVQIDLGNLERSLRTYEGQPWKKLIEKDLRQRKHLELFNHVESAFDMVLQRAVSHRMSQSSQSWPELAPVRLEGVDVLTCDLEKAEQVVASFFKKPDLKVAGKKIIRKVRALAETYRIQPRLFEISFLQMQMTLDSFTGHFRVVDTTVAQQVLNTRRSFTEVKGQILSNWINYQIVRLDLYRDLGLSPP
jgi:hypothetical protein